MKYVQGEVLLKHDLAFPIHAVYRDSNHAQHTQHAVESWKISMQALFPSFFKLDVKHQAETRNKMNC